MDRKAKILAMLDQEPVDVFLRYSLALELAKEGDFVASVNKLTELMSEARYVPAFHMAAQHSLQMQEVEQARTYLREGIEVAREQGDSHAAAEMGELLTSLGELGE